MKTKAIEFEVYKDKKGNPTCARDFMKNEVCFFYRISHYGSRELCGYCDDEMLERRGKQGCGTLIPSENCPFWKNEN